jgi:hypothetical protein
LPGNEFCRSIGLFFFCIFRRPPARREEAVIFFLEHLFSYPYIYAKVLTFA